MFLYGIETLNASYLNIDAFDKTIEQLQASCSQMKCLYTILRVGRNASEGEIRKAYRRLALKYHPDKNGGDDIHFKQIKEAYETLIDSSKRRDYNAKLDGTHNAVIDARWNEVLDAMLMYMMAFMNSCKQEHRKELVVKLPVNIRDLYEHRVKRINIRVKRRQEDGTLQMEAVPFYISLLNYESEYIFKCMGDDAVLEAFPRADVRICLEIKDHPDLKIDTVLNKYDLFIDRYINLYEYYFADAFRINIEGIIDVTVPYTTGARVHLLRGKGLPYLADKKDDHVTRGDLYVHFHLDVRDMSSMCIPDQDIPEFRGFMQKYFNHGYS